MNKAFTLIELLIVVAIIAILAAIAVPNFLEAQVRAKVSRVKNDLRTEDTAITAYQVDHNAVPPCHSFGIALKQDTEPAENTILERLSTPVAYISSALVKDVFKITGRFSASNAAGMQALAQPTLVPPGDAAAKQNSYIYVSWDEINRASFSGTTPPTSKGKAWLLHSCGPDGNYYNLGGVLATDYDPASVPACLDMIYDSTNGTVSRGSIWRTNGTQVGNPQSSGAYAGGAGLIAAIRSQK
ncbi:MAG: prepilin-type N-terminal cleavage/methylation domain-containing protein [Candidatus Sumerlaeaceae bacterium]